jgi:hypothetical protein
MSGQSEDPLQNAINRVKEGKGDPMDDHAQLILYFLFESEDLGQFNELLPKLVEGLLGLPKPRYA